MRPPGALAALAFLLASSAAAQAPEQGRVFILKVLSYNVKGTPVAAFQGYPHDRYAKIGRILAARLKAGDGPDVVLIQESFVPRTRRLREEAGYPHEARGPRAGGDLYGAGLFVLSRFPLSDKRIVEFGDDACASWDCHSNKGALFTRLHVKGLPFPLDVYTTHLQSGAAAKKEAARARQIDVLSAFVAPSLNEKRPVILAGDVNTKPGLPSYGRLVSATGLSNAGPSDIVASSHDQHFYTPSADGGITIRPVLVRRGDPGLDALSDHPPYEVHYEIRW